MISVTGDPMTVPQRKPLLENYLESFSRDFPRRDQFRWAKLYIEGLLRDLPRKNIETLARHLGPPDGQASDLGQALQNLINKSPWDEKKVWRRYRTLVVKALGHCEGVFVVEEVPFVKQGQHSVGVHRQFSQTLAEKVNCQIAVGLHYVSPLGHAPLGLRLYLPRSWIQDAARLVAAGVPPQHRRPLSKAELALELLDEMKVERVPGHRVLAGSVFTSAAEWHDGLRERGFLTQETSSAVDVWQRLRNDLGLDHFEGRSWRGFHHHACLVMLAAGFRQGF